MSSWFQYKASDFDESLHRGSIRLDLQAIDLPSNSLDVILTPHVLEHVPNTERALAEMFRVLAPGGRMFLQVPILQGKTAVPSSPEFHGDNTPVFWRFGPSDLIDQVRAAGFAATMLCLQSWRDAIASHAYEDGRVIGEFAVSDIASNTRLEDLTVVASPNVTDALGIFDDFHFLLFEATKPG